ncbi:MAG: hypothetical protein H6739_38585 [Alphaproteobacteria bacterium]|nr:hypothetical protein [Alphaproteobacteria bacterium]
MNPLAVVLAFLVMAAVPAVVIRLPWRRSVGFWVVFGLAVLGISLVVDPTAALTPAKAFRLSAFALPVVVLNLEPLWRRRWPRAMPVVATALVGFILFGGSTSRAQMGAWGGVALGLLLFVATGGPRSFRWSAEGPSAGATLDVGWAWILAYSAWVLAIGEHYLGMNLVGRKIVHLGMLLALAGWFGQQHYLRLRSYMATFQFCGALLLPAVFVEGMSTPTLGFEGFQGILHGVAAVCLVPALRRNAQRWWKG